MTDHLPSASPTVVRLTEHTETDQTRRRPDALLADPGYDHDK
ncbi:hypothetical protein HEP87_62950 [Streptomyces sp. S1D4-11]|nr:hypothetical protein [Streptomyces sp. S1D4-11]